MLDGKNVMSYCSRWYVRVTWICLYEFGVRKPDLYLMLYVDAILRKKHKLCSKCISFSEMQKNEYL